MPIRLASGEVPERETRLRFDDGFRRRWERPAVVFGIPDTRVGGLIDFLSRCRSDAIHVLQIGFDRRLFRVMCVKTGLALKGKGGCV